MGQHDYRNPNEYRGDRRPGPGQMDQFAEGNRQHDGQYDRGQDYGRGYGYQRDEGDRGRHEGMRHADSTQAGYGRYGAPAVHGQPTGGYERPAYEPAHTSYGQYERGGRDDEWRDRDRYGRNYPGGYGRSYQGGYGQGYGEDRQPYGGHQDAGNPYRGSQTYGGYGDSQGYGQDRGYTGGRRHQSHYDPDYSQWREHQMQQLDEEYDSWRGERYKKFSDEFDTWRKSRKSDDKSGAKSSSSGTSASSTVQGSGTK